jgi:hypothetical protein
MNDIASPKVPLLDANGNPIKSPMPQLQYTGGNNDNQNGKQIIESNKVKFKATFDNIKNSPKNVLSQMKFVLARYDIYGNFYKFETLTHQLFLCDISDDDL